MKNWKVLALVLLVAIITVGATTKHGSKTIRATRFELVDEAGKIFGAWTSDSNGVSLVLRDRASERAFVVRLDQKEAYLVLGQGDDGINLQVIDSHPMIKVEESGETAYYTKDLVRAPRFELVDPNDNMRGCWAVDSNTVGFRLLDELSKASLNLMVDRDGSPAIILDDSNGNSLLSLVVSDTGGGIMVTGGDNTIGLGFPNSKSDIVFLRNLRNKDGEIVLSQRSIDERINNLEETVVVLSDLLKSLTSAAKTATGL